MERAIKEITSSKELSNLYQDIAKQLLQETALKNQEYLFLAALEKSLIFLADEIYEKFPEQDSIDITSLSLAAKWKLLSNNKVIENLIIQETNTNGVLDLIDFYQSALLLPKNNNLISSDNNISLKKLNELLDKSYRWSDLLRKTLDEC
ncbi:MAG: hypothetical protein ACJ0FU_04630 [Gammaproteobacteria bacterium]|jgi:hypothetical protein|tara:strand:- start:1990 stop:2436 length:447 start_codon:yes stop_codon:yes gene_type:complete